MRYDCYVMGRPKRYGTAAEKQKAYRERKKNLPVPVLAEQPEVNRRPVEAGEEARESTTLPDLDITQSDSRGGQNLHTIETLRELIAEEHEKPVEANVVPLVYRDDYGRVISERQWKTLQERKRRANESGYVIDEYSQ